MGSAMQISCDFDGRKSVSTFFVTEADEPAVILGTQPVQLSLALNANRTREQVTPT